MVYDYEGPPSKFKEFFEARARKLRKSTLGDLAKEWNSKFCQSGVPTKPEKALPHSHMALHFRVETRPEHAKAMKRQLRSLVAERNRLIHQDLAAFDPNSADCCHKLITFLDEQNQRIISQVRALEKLHRVAATSLQALFDSMNTDRVLRHFAPNPPGVSPKKLRAQS